MEITSQSFSSYLPWVLNEISASCFVALDLELSGIALAPSSQGARTQTLQQRYEETKAAAEKYQILQVGLTICREDPKNGYVLKPYNINLNPLLNRDLDINRDCTFNGWATEFLMNNRFDLNSLYRDGVRYLSRREEEEAMEQGIKKCNPHDTVDTRGLELDNPESIDFLQAVRRELDNWLAQDQKRSRSINIPPSFPLPSLHGKKTLPKVLNNMQKWLVHHLVNTEYPNLKSRRRPAFIYIELSDPARDEVEKAERMKAISNRVRKHVGFRWITEALVGGDLTDLEPQTFKDLMAKLKNPGFTLTDLSDRLKERLKENRPVLVGHNCFTDLVFFYKCFLGPLPATITEFMDLVHTVFPMLADTKYLATQNSDAMSPTSSLEELNKSLAKLSCPRIDIDTIHSKYLYKTSIHEAGYDSMLAAIAFIKLSAQLSSGAEHGKMPKGKRGRLEDMEIGLVNNPTPAAAVRELFPNCRPRMSNSSRNRFQDFFDTEDEGENTSPPTPRTQNLSRMVLEDNGSDEIASMIRHGLLVPRLGTEFWEVYGNRLRVFGTAEKVIRLGGTLMSDAN
ncbi:hypothetical protein N7462_005067 [Penicillium macrosclerotiorum]|uniref:uncharacterized protein n=1 Tax=Penicillium macrosclerotiorum TaxID=303699 RepID=UPI002548E571|nr:uncharacterized protein N7462_005067 [Penicillium macrosclerotiorum]KAJ5690675.1 hypothetical protein N7462_005067 [Penicillium macrosclerotiorum]